MGRVITHIMTGSPSLAFKWRSIEGEGSLSAEFLKWNSKIMVKENVLLNCMHLAYPLYSVHVHFATKII